MIAPLVHYSHVAVNKGVARISGRLPRDADRTPATDAPFPTQARMALRELQATRRSNLDNYSRQPVRIASTCSP
ncbi:hypothetical protein [Streptomyces sp. NPDC006274]|uniref:hypothetical protein n=1 Tax=unclassified Streptomyces TaxID=2593676 RepID=UPI0033BB0759